jgi:geranylgeranyl diphosphate synthase type II
MADATEILSRRAGQVNAALRDCLADDADAGRRDALPVARSAGRMDGGSPVRLVESMRYSIDAGGKRIRPALVLEACAACGGRDADAMPAAVAVECVHTFSLIHDDLPAMDDDDLRRGRPTNHKVFGEAMAILAGDALLTLAFEVLAGVRPAARGLAMVARLASATGRSGMIGGQVRDLEGEAKSLNPDEIRLIHEQKTAALIEASCVMGGLAAGAGEDARKSLGAYGCKLGLAFQAVDDLLDVTESRAALGKTPGKDAASGKQSLAAAVGIEEGRRIASLLCDEAIAAVEPLGDAAGGLVALARFVVDRRW